MKALIEEFNNMSKLPMFEIQHVGEYYIYNIEATEDGLETNCGISIEWEEDGNLDYYLEGLYELCLEDAQSNDNRNEISKDDLIEIYNDMLDECYEGIFNLLPSTILERCDPIQYECGLSDYYDSMRDNYYCEEME